MPVPDGVVLTPAFLTRIAAAPATTRQREHGWIWRRLGNVRLAAAFRPHLKASRGCMINIGSMYSYFGAPQIPAYAAAKTAVVGLTKSLALAYIDDGIRVNAIAPGWIETEISRRGREDPEFNARLMQRLPNKRWADPDELAGTALFLASPASRLINGVTIPVDGGYVAA